MKNHINAIYLFNLTYMNLQELQQKSCEIANEILGNSNQSLPKKEIEEKLSSKSEYEIFCNAILQALPDRFERISKNPGGIKRKPKPNSQNKLNRGEEKSLWQAVEGIYLKATEPKAKGKEEIIEEAFHNWLKNPQNTYNKDYKIINFNSSARKGKEGENVDGFAVGFVAYEYHLLFRPILTTFEVKAELPNKLQGINKAKGYLNFSHHVYLVFKFEGSEEELNLALKDSGYNEHDGVGIYYTSDGESFKRLTISKPKNAPLSIEVENHLNRLLSDKEKAELLNFKKSYIKETIANVLIG